MVLIANTGIGNSCVVIRWCILGKLIYMLGKKSIIVSCIFCFCGGDCSINNGDDNNRCVDSNIYNDDYYSDDNGGCGGGGGGSVSQSLYFI